MPRREWLHGCSLKRHLQHVHAFCQTSLPARSFNGSAAWHLQYMSNLTHHAAGPRKIIVVFQAGMHTCSFAISIGLSHINPALVPWQATQGAAGLLSPARLLQVDKACHAKLDQTLV